MTAKQRGVVLGVFVTLAIMSLLFVVVSERRLGWALCAILNTLAAGLWAQSPVDRPSEPAKNPKVNSRGGSA